MKGKLGGDSGRVRLITMRNAKVSDREPAANDVRFVSERIGWPPFAGPFGSEACRSCPY